MKNSYWIKDAEGAYALVEGADQRDTWTRVHGWRETTEPGPNDRVHIVHPEVGHGGPLPYEATIGTAWAGLGWKPGPPPQPTDLTKDPRIVDQPDELAAVEPAKSATATAAGGTSKEK